MNKLWTGFAVLTTVTFLTACGSSGGTSNSSNSAPAAKTSSSSGSNAASSNGTGGGSAANVTIGLSFPAADHGWMAAVIQDAKDEAGAKGVKFYATTASNPNDQVSGIQDLLTKKVNAIVEDPIDTNALTPVAAQVKSANVPLVLFDRGIADKNYTEMVTGDNKAIGTMAAKYINQQLNGQGDIVIISGVPGDVTDARTNGFTDEIKNDSGLKVLTNQSGKFTEQDAYNVMQNVLQSQSHIDAVYSEDDEMSLGVLKAIEQAHRSDIKVVTGTGGDKNFYGAIKDNTYPNIKLTTFTYSPLMVKQAVDDAIAIAQGQSPTAQDKVIPPTQVDSSNVSQYYDANANY